MEIHAENKYFTGLEGQGHVRLRYRLGTTTKLC